MSHVVSIGLGSQIGACRTWSLVYGGTVYKMSWADGERLLGFSTGVRSGALEPQPFVFCPLGNERADVVSVDVTPDGTLALILTEEDPPPRQSHWFG